MDAKGEEILKKKKNCQHPSNNVFLHVCASMCNSTKMFAVVISKPTVKKKKSAFSSPCKSNGEILLYSSYSHVCMIFSISSKDFI